MGRLKGRTAVVTGAAQGIGRATAAAFVHEAARVIAVDIDEANLSNLDGCTHRCLDLSNGPAVASLAREFADVDILFNCAGYVHTGAILECSEEDWNRSFTLNAGTMFFTIRAFLPGMLKQHYGSIINMASVASSIKGVPNRCAYATSKAAVIGLTKSIAADYITSGVRCNAICPGTVESPSLQGRIIDQAARSGASEADIRTLYVARQPMGRMGKPEEIAALAIYLASDEASYTTGTIQVIDGGLSM